jgi:predicted porin
MKKVLSLAIAAALVAPMAAMADATVYGKVRVASTKIDADVADSWGMYDESSRLGIKGSEDLGDGLKAIYKMEFGVATGSAFGGLSGRNAYVGLAGGFGTALAGRHDTPMKMSTGKLDLFADTIGDNDMGGTHMGIIMDRRVDGAIAYVSPSMSGFTVAGAVVQTTATDDFQDAISVAAMYSNGPWYGSLAYEALDGDMTGGNDEKQTRIGLGMLGMSGFSATLVYETRSDIGGTADSDTTAYTLNGAYKMGAHTIKAAYNSIDGDGASSGADADGYALGYQFNFSKRTDAQVLYTNKDFDAATANDKSKFSLQLNTKF